MSATLGNERPAPHVHQEPHDRPARFLVIIDSAGAAIARLFLEDREEVAEFDAGAEEVSMMTAGLVPSRDASRAEWDHALAGHSASERAGAAVYTLDL